MTTNLFVSNVPKHSISDVCDPPEDYTQEQLLKPFANGVGTDTLAPSSDSGRIPVDAIRMHVKRLTDSGIIPQRPLIKVGTTYETDMEKHVKADKAFYEKLQQEYCYYEQRYRFALKTFLEKATSRKQSDNNEAELALRHAKTLNLRVNSVLEVMNYLAQSRVSDVNSNKEAINKHNASILDKLDKLKNSYKLLNHDNAIVLTQKESVRYTHEKNNYTNNQIAVWASLNILALGVIFYVYRA